MRRELRKRKKNEEGQREREAWTCLQVELKFFSRARSARGRLFMFSAAGSGPGAKLVGKASESRAGANYRNRK